MLHTPSANRCSMRAPISCLWSNPSRHAIQVFTRALYPEHRLDPGAEQEDTSLRRALLSLDDRSADSEHERCRTRHMGGKDRARTPKAGHLQADLLHDAFHQPDGNEAQCAGGCSLSAILICNRGTGKLGQRLLVADVICPPYETCHQQSDEVLWPFAEIVSPELITDIDRRNQSLVTIHSHPTGQARFSAINDKNDQVLLPSVSGWFDDERPHGAAVMQADGVIRARTVDEARAFEAIQTVAVIGDEIRCWRQATAGSAEPHETRLKQTFGQGTLKLLRGMRVGVVGCSGTGSIIVELLTRNAVRELVIVDHDTLDTINLNRIVNSTSADAELQKPKVLALKEADDRIGLGTVVHALEGITDSAAIVRALIDCDVIFGCVDTAFGRYHLDCIASAYLIPYFDVGVHLDADGDEGIHAADAVAHYVHPEGGSLLSRGVYTMDQVTAELWHHTDPAYYEQQRRADYLAAVGEDQPAVMSINMQASCLAFNDFLARVSGFRLDANEEFTTQRFRLVHGSFEIDADREKPHRLLRPYIGAGDQSLLVRNNIAHD